MVEGDEEVLLAGGGTRDIYSGVIELHDGEPPHHQVADARLLQVRWFIISRVVFGHVSNLLYTRFEITLKRIFVLIIWLMSLLLLVTPVYIYVYYTLMKRNQIRLKLRKKIRAFT